VIIYKSVKLNTISSTNDLINIVETSNKHLYFTHPLVQIFCLFKHNIISLEYFDLSQHFCKMISLYSCTTYIKCTEQTQSKMSYQI
jgi:hypothetical protein